MGKNTVRSWKRRVDAMNTGKSSEQVHREKCQRKRSRGEHIKAANKAVETWRKGNRALPDYPRYQLNKLDERLGVNVGATRERERLIKEFLLV